MNQSRVVHLIVLFLAALACSRATGAVIDNFDEYTSSPSPYLQGSGNTLTTAQQGTNGKWLRYGTAISDGIYSSGAAGNGGRGAVADASFNGSTATTYICNFNFTSAYDLSSSGSCTITLDMKVTSGFLANTAAYITVQDATGEQYQSQAVSLASDSTYQTFSFVFATGSVTNTANVSPYDSLATVLASTTQIDVLFKDTADSGAEAIDFDNLDDVVAVPEPSTGATLLTLLAGIALLGILRRLFAKNTGY